MLLYYFIMSNSTYSQLLRVLFLNLFTDQCIIILNEDCVYRLTHCKLGLLLGLIDLHDLQQLL